MTQPPGSSSHRQPQPHEWQHGGPYLQTPQSYGQPFGQPYGESYHSLRAAPEHFAGPYAGAIWARSPGHPDRDPHAYVAPLIATVLGGPLMLIGLLAAGISPMATDSCTPHGCHALHRALLTAPCVLGLAVATLVVAWALPWRRRNRGQRYAAAVAAPLLAATTLLIYATLPAAG